MRLRGNSLIDRRVFIGATASALIAIPFAARAQQKDKVRHIGVLAHGEPPTLAEIQEFWAPARELGWIEGRNLIVERRYAKGQAALLRPFAEELVRLNVEIIVTYGTDATLAAKNATSSIPIVFFSVGDPVGAGLVASLARPGGNITGLSLGAQGVDAKRLSLLRELLPGVQRVGDLENPNNPFFRLARNDYEQSYRSLGIQRILIEVATASELENAVAEVARRGGQALVIPSDGLFESNRITIMRAALHHALPTFVEGRDYLEAGALLSYARNGTEAARQSLTLIDKVLRGAKLADLPVQEPTRFELLINLKTAKALHIPIPRSLLLRADDVIR